MFFLKKKYNSHCFRLSCSEFLNIATVLIPSLHIVVRVLPPSPFCREYNIPYGKNIQGFLNFYEPSVLKWTRPCSLRSKWTKKNFYLNSPAKLYSLVFLNCDKVGLLKQTRGNLLQAVGEDKTGHSSSLEFKSV